LLINEYTAPAYFMMIIVTVSIILLITIFTDCRREENDTMKLMKKSRRLLDIERIANEPVLRGYLTKYDSALLGCMLLNLGTKGTIACFETMGIQYSESHFNIYRATAGMIVAACGLIGVCSILCIGQIQKYLNDTEMIYSGMTFVSIAIFMNIFLAPNNQNPIWRFVLMIFMIYGIGYPIGHTALIGIFSKIVGRQPQGPLQGWFSFSGSLARVCFPIIAGYIIRSMGIEILLSILTFVSSLAILITYTFRNILTRLSM